MEWDKERLEAIGRFLLFMITGMLVGYTLVTLFGLIIGGVLSFLVVWCYIKVINRIIDDIDPAGSSSNRAGGAGTAGGLSIFSPVRPRLKYRCLSCYHIYSGKRECPKCGSRLKHAEF